MSTASFTVSWSLGTEANFQTLQAISTALGSTFGLTRTASGPSWSSGTVHSTGTWEVYAFADALQATKPFYFYIGYVADAGRAPGIPCLQFQVGTGYSSGAVTGNTSPFMTLCPSLNNNACFPYTANQQYCYMSGSTNRFNIALGEGPNLYATEFISVERTHDTTGADTGDGCIVYTTNGDPAAFNTLAAPANSINMVVPSTGIIAGYNTAFVAAIPAGATTMSTATNVGCAQVVPFNFIPYNPGLGVMMYAGTDFPVYTSQSITVYGSAHTYLPLQQVYSYWSSPAATMHLLMRYE